MQEYVGLVSEYVHSVAHHDGDVPPDVKALAQKTWHALKRSAKAGPRVTVRCCRHLAV